MSGWTLAYGSRNSLGSELWATLSMLAEVARSYIYTVGRTQGVEHPSTLLRSTLGCLVFLLLGFLRLEASGHVIFSVGNKPAACARSRARALHPQL